MPDHEPQRTTYGFYTVTVRTPDGDIVFRTENAYGSSAPDAVTTVLDRDWPVTWEHRHRMTDAQQQQARTGIAEHRITAVPDSGNARQDTLAFTVGGLLVGGIHRRVAERDAARQHLADARAALAKARAAVRSAELMLDLAVAAAKLGGVEDREADRARRTPRRPRHLPGGGDHGRR